MTPRATAAGKHSEGAEFAPGIVFKIKSSNVPAEERRRSEAGEEAGLTAGHIEEGAVDGRDPEVRGARVKQHSELLRGRADADRPVVLGLAETSWAFNSLIQSINLHN